MKKRLITILLSALFSTSVVWGNLADSFGFSAKGIGSAGARTATVDDWTSAYYNMAGLAAMTPKSRFLRGRRKQRKPKKILLTGLETSKKKKSKSSTKKKKRRKRYESQVGFSYNYQLSLLNIDTATTNSTVEENLALAQAKPHYGMMNLGFVMDMRSIINTYKDLPIRLGASIALRDNGLITAVNDTRVESYSFQRVGRNAQRLVMLMGVGAQVWKNRLSIGFGTNIFAGGQGKFKMTDVEIDPTGQTQVPRQEMMLDVTPTIALAGGIMYKQPIKRYLLMVGLSYRGEIYMELDPLIAEATTELLKVDLPMRMAILDFYTPHIITMGFAWFHHSFLKISLDFEYQMWSKFKISSAKEISEPEIPSFKDSYSSKIAFESRLGSIPLGFLKKLRHIPLWVRMGFAYQTAFTPDQTTESNYLDNDKIIISFGSQYVLPKNIMMKIPTILNFGMQAQIWTNRSTTKETVKEPAYNPDYTYGGLVLVFSLSAEWRF